MYLILENERTTTINQTFELVAEYLLENEKKINTRNQSFKLFGEHLQSPCDQSEVL